ncbi:hypothetical protein IH879_01615 [candidate division KSB1 bacterium]|nr:hypothetical protein [candidate division KSB1 bacterium]
MHFKPSIILIRETDAQLTGSGCCGKLEGDNAKFNDSFVFAETRKIKETMGDVFQTLTKRFSDSIEISVVDPRNFLYLYPKILKDVFVFRPSLKSTLKALFMMIAVPSIIINGEIFRTSDFSNNEEVAQRIESLITANKEKSDTQKKLVNFNKASVN